MFGYVLLSFLINNSSLTKLCSWPCRRITFSSNCCSSISQLVHGFSLLKHNHKRHGLSISSTSDIRTKMSASIINNYDDSSTSILPILVVGSANYDITSYTSKLPQPGETVLADEQQQIDLSCGGKGANQAKAAACLLPKQQSKVHMICRVGNDIFGHEILNTFQQHGIRYDPNNTIIQYSNERQQSEENDKVIHTGVASIIVDTKTGENQIIVTPGANHALQPIDVRKDIVQYRAMRSKHVVLLQLEIPHQTVYEAVTTVRDQQDDASFIILNPAPVPNDPTVLQQLKENYFHMIDVLIPNETELRQLCSNKTDNDNEVELATLLLNTYNIRRAVIVTLGSRGALVVERKSNKKRQSPSADINTTTTTTITSTYVTAPLEIINLMNNQTIIDTVGAGDAFCGVFAAYMSATLNTQDNTSSTCDLSQLASMACGYATMSVYRRGTNYPIDQEIPQCLQIGTLLPIPASSSVTQQSSEPGQKRKVLTFVTGNAKKLEEVRQILGKGVDDFPYTITNQKIDLPELQGNDVYEIAKEKCRIAAKIIEGPCFIEDTSLCFNALHGLPGPYIKWFLEKCGHHGLNQMLIGFDDKTAYAQTVVAYTEGCSSNDEIHTFDGRTDGTIVLPRGSLDFGWDPIFEPNEGNGLTYAEMDKSAKNSISHRGRSFTKFQLFLNGTK